MRITRPNTLIPYFTADLIHYFHSLKTKFDRKKDELQNRIVGTLQNHIAIEKRKKNFFICS